LAATLENFAAMKASNLFFALSVISSIALVSCGKAEPTNNPAGNQTANTNSTGEVAVINTTEGTMVVAFWPDVAPNTVANFKKLANQGFYDGTCFHRVIKNFMIQGGDPLTKDSSKEALWGTGDPGYKIKAEFNDRSHTRGVISMARSQDPDSAGSQFFICHGNPTFLDHQYTAFGKLIKGDDVLEKIATTPTHPPDRPDKRVGVISIKIVPADSVK
jgi:peptidyl-prolyl cis-trans isomerase B (cyclophilin B)